ncbi:unnamed protein product [Cuscuta europaea]|uniref:Uncharacterized protein n=1 Tax=Cuscuta europaea TaxID=41803 RepID=A0A9P0ZGV1_CUSEU|nr:unnamed protein product [Cuscuta europaea]
MLSNDVEFLLKAHGVKRRLREGFEACLKGANVEFVEPVKANFWCCAGHCFWITFRARDLSSNTDTKLYQTKVWRFMDKIEVCIFRERPTDEEIASVHVEIPEYACFK